MRCGTFNFAFAINPIAAVDYTGFEERIGQRQETTPLPSTVTVGHRKAKRMETGPLPTLSECFDGRLFRTRGGRSSYSDERDDRRDQTGDPWIEE